MTTLQKVREKAPYGCDTFGRLRRVLLHRPRALHLITRENFRQWLFDDVPDVPRFLEEHDRYRELLQSCDVEVAEVADHLNGRSDRCEFLPNLTYLHDVAVVSSRGALLSSMSTDARRGEEDVIRDVLQSLGIPLLHAFDHPEDAFEGCLLLSPETLLVAHTERHNHNAIEKFIPRALETFQEVLYVDIPRARRFMHPDTIYNRVDHHLALAYPPAFRRTLLYTRNDTRPVNFFELMRRRGIEIVPVSDAEQAALACSFVPLEPGVIIHYESALSPETKKRLLQRGVELILFSPSALLAGGGSLRCLTLRLYRESRG